MSINDKTLTELQQKKEYTLDCLLWQDDPLEMIPVVTQDYDSREVLILAYVNKEAFDETVKTGLATYWSRSRDELWTKGKTSGDLLKVVDIRINCDQNSLVYLVEPQGNGACHAKDIFGIAQTSCYYRSVVEKQGKYKLIPLR